jgi:hypothetical protein
VLLLIDGVTFQVVLFGGGGELSAKIGTSVVRDVPIDLLFYVGKAQAYTTVVNTTRYYIPLVPAAALVDGQQLRALVSEERSRRASEKAALAEERQQKAIQGAAQRLRRTFTDASGQHTVDAVVVRVDRFNVTLLRMDNKREVVLPVSGLSSRDQEWIGENKFWVDRYGAAVLEHVRK